MASASASSADHLLALLNKEGYDVMHELGKGQFGKVMLAKERVSGKLIAVKVVAESHASENERSMIGRPAHPNVLQIYKSVFEPKLDVNVCFMEYCNKGDLQVWFDKNDRPLSFPEVLVFFTQVSCGIQWLHTNNIAHRDIKPSNILMTETDGWITYKLGDFGTVRDKEMMETLAGTPYFMAPEVEEGSYGKEVDQWSLGCMLFYCCTLRQLFDARTRLELRDMVHRALTPDIVRDRLAGEPRCKFTEVERERMAFAVSALVQLQPAQRIAIADLLQQIQPIAQVRDALNGECRPVPINLAVRPTVKSLVEQTAAVFGRAPQNLHLLAKHGVLTDAALDAMLWGAIELLMVDDEAYLGNHDALSESHADDFELVEAEDSPDALSARARRLKLKFASKIPELQAAACMRDAVAHEQAAAMSTMKNLRLAMELFSSIVGIADDDEQLVALVQIEKYISIADVVLQDSSAFFTASDSPIVVLAKEFSTIELPSTFTEHDLPQLLHRHFASVATRFEEFSATLRLLLRGLLQHHASLTGLRESHGALALAAKALERYRALMQGIVERAAHAQAERHMSASVSAAVSEQLAAARAESAAALDAARAEGAAVLAKTVEAHAAAQNAVQADLARTRAALAAAEKALRQAQLALEGREREVGVPSDLAASFDSRLAVVLDKFYNRSLDEANAAAAAAAAAAALASRQQLGEVTEELAHARSELEATQLRVSTLETDVADKHRTNEHLRERAVTYTEQLQGATARVTELVKQVEVLRADALKQEGDFTRNLGEQQQRFSAAQAENDALKHQIEALQQEQTELAKQAQNTQALVQQRAEHTAQLEKQLAVVEAALSEARDTLAQQVAEAATVVRERTAALDTAAQARAVAEEQVNALQRARVAAESEAAQAHSATELARQRVQMLENAMRDSATRMNQLDTALRNKEKQLQALQAENSKLRESVAAQSPPPTAHAAPAAIRSPAVPLFTPPPLSPAVTAAAAVASLAAPLLGTSPRAVGASGVSSSSSSVSAMPTKAEFDTLRADNTNLAATVRQLQSQLAQMRQHATDADRRITESAASLARSQADAALLAQERDALRADKTHMQELMRELDDQKQQHDEQLRLLKQQLEEQQQRMQIQYEALHHLAAREHEHEHEREHGLGAEERQLLTHLQGENVEQARTMQVQADEIQAARLEIGSLTEQLQRAEWRAEGVREEVVGLQRHVQHLAQENTRLQRAQRDDLAPLVVETARFLFRNHSDLRGLDECAARLHSMLERSDDFALLALQNFQYGDPVMVQADNTLLQKGGRAPVRLDPGSIREGVHPGSVVTVVLVDQDTVHAEATM